MAAAVNIEQLSKTYGRRRGIQSLSLTVERGEIFGFLGPNGAGKTTTLRLLLGFLRPTAGSARVLDLDVVGQSVEVRKRTGYLPSESNLYPHLTGGDIVDFALRARGHTSSERASAIADRLGIDLSVKVKHCSKGMRQKIAIVASMAHDPELLILDEPDTGLDPLVQRIMNELLREEARRGRTVVFSSHNLSAVEALCSRVAILREGRLVDVDEVVQLQKRRSKRVSASFATAPPSVEGIPGLKDLEVTGNRITFRVNGDIRPALRLLGVAEVTDVRVEDPSLEEIFLEQYSGAA